MKNRNHSNIFQQKSNWKIKSPFYVRNIYDILHTYCVSKSSAYENISKKIYYLVGPPGAGKSEISKHIQSDYHIREWSEDPPELLYLPSERLTVSESEEVDRWIETQIIEKTKKINEIVSGIVVVDRSPLDMITFPTFFESMIQRATKFYNFYYGKIRSEGSIPIDGMLIHLRLSLDELMKRRELKKLQGKDYSPISSRSEKDLEFDRFVFETGTPEIQHVETDGLKSFESAKIVNEIINDKPYLPLNFEKYMKKLINRLNSLGR